MRGQALIEASMENKVSIENFCETIVASIGVGAKAVENTIDTRRLAACVPVPGKA